MDSIQDTLPMDVLDQINDTAPESAEFFEQDTIDINGKFDESYDSSFKDSSDIPEITEINYHTRKEKMKKPLSAWLIYSTENRARIHKENPSLSFKEIAQTLSENYKSISDEEKKRIEELASMDKLRYQREIASLKEYEATHSISSLSLPTPELNNKTTELIIPLARIKRTMKFDTDVNHIQKQALIAVTKATELFLQYLGTRSYHVALKRRGKSIKTSDLIQCVHSLETLTFLRADFPKSMAPSLDKRSTKPSSTSTSNASRTTKTVASTGGTILNFFGHKRKADFLPDDTQADTKDEAASYVEGTERHDDIKLGKTEEKENGLIVEIKS